MGITIHYKGSLKERDRIDKLREELIDISNVMRWDYVLVEPDEFDFDIHPPVYGIVVQMDNKCESLPFIFDNNGDLCSLSVLNHYDETDEHQLTVSVKTQFSCPHDHIVIVKLLRYIKKAYIKDMEVSDEGEYWETSNIERLEFLFEFLNKKIGAVANAFEYIEDFDGDPQNIIERLENLIKERFDIQDQSGH